MKQENTLLTLVINPIQMMNRLQIKLKDKKYQCRKAYLHTALLIL